MAIETSDIWLKAIDEKEVTENQKILLKYEDWHIQTIETKNNSEKKSFYQAYNGGKK